MCKVHFEAQSASLVVPHLARALHELIYAACAPRSVSSSLASSALVFPRSPRAGHAASFNPTLVWLGIRVRDCGWLVIAGAK